MIQIRAMGRLGRAFLLMALVSSWSSSNGAVFLVTNTDDSGRGSLRQALDDANVTPELDTISFAIPGEGPHSLLPKFQLPEVVQPVVIDATTQTGYQGQPIVELDGSESGFLSDGLLITGGGSVVKGLVINRFEAFGIHMEGKGGNLVEACYIGTDLSGTMAAPNGFGGIGVGNSPNNRIGGATVAERNLISGNDFAGIYILGITAADNVIHGNLIGTDFKGGRALPNEGAGIFISGSPATTIGGGERGVGNVISGNSAAGIGFFASTESEIALTVVRGNAIGTNLSGDPIGNLGGGIVVAGGVIEPGSGSRIEIVDNRIANNQDDGIKVLFASRVRISENSIFGNSGLGINLGFDEATPNDIGDLDEDANGLQNYPILSELSLGAPGIVRLQGSLKSKPQQSYVLEFFASPDCDPLGFGEGAILMGTREVRTDDTGLVVFNFEFEFDPSGYAFATATATDSGGNTSEFSPCVTPQGRLAAFLGPAPYLSVLDSPFLLSVLNGDFLLEDFESGALSVPGVAASAGSVIGPGGLTDSVDSDDGDFDGVGTLGRSFFSENGPQGIRFQFDAATLGQLPTHVGLVWTDGPGAVSFEAIDGRGLSVGGLNGFDLDDGFDAGGTKEDRFFGVIHQPGIAEVRLWNSEGAIEVDHLQFGPVRVAGAPVIVGHPSDQVVVPGATLTLAVVATGNPPLRYQWSWNGVHIPGATSDTLVIGNFQPERSGVYNVTVANDLGAVDSEYALVGADRPLLNFVNDFADIVPVALENFSGQGSNIDATFETGEPPALNAADDSVWLSVDAVQGGIATASTAGSSIDTVLEVFVGNSLDTLRLVAFNDDRVEIESLDDSANELTSQVSINVQAGQTYHLKIASFGGDSGAINFDVQFEPTDNRLPEIVQKPTDLVLAPNQSGEFSIGAIGANLEYQWFKNLEPIAGATSDRLPIAQATEADVGLYVVRVASSDRVVLSDVVEVALNIPQFGPTQNLITARKFAELERALRALFRPPDIGIVPQGVELAAQSRALAPAAAAPASGFSGAQVFSTFGAVKEVNEPNHCGVVGGASVWFAYQAPALGTLVISTEGSDFDTVLAVYTGGAGGFETLQPVACDNDSGADGQDSRVRFPAEAGALYLVAVDGVGGVTGNVNLSYQLSAPPRFESIRQAEGGIALEIVGPPNRKFHLERSTDLLQWNSIMTTNTISGVAGYIDLDPISVLKRFFRVSLTP